jgi:hypothetical protein
MDYKKTVHIGIFSKNISAQLIVKTNNGLQKNSPYWNFLEEYISAINSKNQQWITKIHKLYGTKGIFLLCPEIAESINQ